MLLEKFLRRNIAISYRLLDKLNSGLHLSQDGLFRTELKLFLASLAPTLQGKRVLDVGSGPWNGPKEIFSSWCSITTFDIVPHEQVDVVGDLYQLSDVFSHVPPFDAVIATEVFEHVADIPIVLQQIKHVLTPGGRIVISTPFKKNLHGEDYGDYWRITRQGWRYLLEQAGFESIAITWLGEELLPLAYFVQASRSS
ncbi:class I SAM-dependent methyltransferase [Candidatus Uhrbacteria bacterium]|nr:class I SAM-dependent methyltransferase [Candidatus Uhrbacteria bacterium]